jgi:menaquinone reductase, molybdopterin-binding-like subunit
VTRRDLFKFVGGAAAGVMLTPAPWKAIDDLAIWTQNWSWIPVPPKGAVTTRATICSLCPAGCAVEARCVGGLPIAMRPLGSGKTTALCTLGMTGHHLAYHPARLRHPSRILRGSDGSRRIPLPLDTVMSAMSGAIAAATPSRRVAVLDMRPGRSVSFAWRQLLASLPGGVLIPSPAREGSSLTALEAMTASRSYGIDPNAARTILSFGAPLAEGWGTPESTARVLGAGEPKLRLIQIEPLLSRTAQAADRWLAARPGTETVLALGIGHVLLSEHLVSGADTADLDAYAALVARFIPETVSAMTGVPAAAVVSTARELVDNGPSLVVAGDDAGTGRLGTIAETAIQALNLLLAESGHGCMISRRALPDPFETASLAPQLELDRIEDRSIGLLVIDASAGDLPMPWSLVKEKLAADAVVVAVSPYFAGTAERADFVIPSPAFLESVHEVPTTFDSPVASLRLSAPLICPRVETIDPAALVRAIAERIRVDLPGEWASSEELMKARVARIHAAGQGSVVGPSGDGLRALADLTSAEELWEALLAGSRWESERSGQPATPRALLGGIPADRWAAATQTSAEGLKVLFRAPRDVSASSAVSPLFTKLYQESGLRRAVGTGAINPATARALGLKRGSQLKLAAKAGSVVLTVATDEAVMPGVVVIHTGPTAAALGMRGKPQSHGFLDVFSADEDGAWRSMNVSVVEA